MVSTVNYNPVTCVRGADDTGAGLFDESAKLAEQVIAYMDERVLPQNSNRLLFDAAGELVWVAEDEGMEVQYDRDPESTPWKRWIAAFIRILPIKDQLWSGRSRAVSLKQVVLDGKGQGFERFHFPA